MFRWRTVLMLLLLLSGLPAFAAGYAEKHAFSVASEAFKWKEWANAETNFAAFVEKFPESEDIAAAILFQGECRYMLHQYDGAISLLSTNLPRAGLRADEFAYWIAEAQFAKGDYARAADNFSQLQNKFPGSLKRLDACLGEAEARTKLREWPRVIELLQRPDGVFQQQLKIGGTNSVAARGFLLLCEAQLEREDFDAANTTLRALEGRGLTASQRWQRDYLRCGVELGEGRAEAAAETCTNLLANTEAIRQPEFRAESFAIQGRIFERLGRTEDAITAYTNNLASEAPAARQRAAMLKIADLSIELNRISRAVATLEDFLARYTNSPAADVALVTLGELRLKQFLGGQSGTETNLLDQALTNINRALDEFPDAPLAAKGLLDRGWCLWLQGNYSGSLDAFQSAAFRLRDAHDRAVARFKWADAQFMLSDYAGAMTNYSFIVSEFDSAPTVHAELVETALYQIVRAALEIGNLESATNALEKILSWYPNGFAGDRCLLLTGQGFVEHGNPERARELFSRFEAMYPSNALAEEVRLAIARSYEQEGKWAAAITNYNAWSEIYTNGTRRATAEFNRAWDNYMAGHDTNAFTLFTNFVARFTNDPLVLQAQWWIGDYNFRQNDFIDAESAYHLVFRNTNWPPSNLSFQAEMMAGRAAMARQDYRAATNYFSKLPSDTNCPLELRMEATLAMGDALIARPSPDWNEAIAWFSSITQAYPTNEFAPVAWGKAGNCYLQLERYDEAANAYQHVLDLPQSRVAARSEARVGLGVIAEKLAKTKTGENQAALLQQAVNHYEDVVLDKDLRVGERPDLFWVKEAGLRAVRVVSESLGDWERAIKLCGDFAEAHPDLQPLFQGKIEKARMHLASPEK